MKIKLPSLRKSSYGFAAALMLLATVGSSLLEGKAYAFAQLTERSITMSDATNSGSGTDGTNVTYTVSFKLATQATAVKAVVIEFCDTSPVIGYSTCGTVTGLSASAATVGSATGWTGGGTWAPTNTASKIILKNTSSTNPTAGTAVGFVLNGITNPSTANHTFFARVVTYDSGANADNYASGTVSTGSIDAGGIALSTTNQINVSGTVAESLTFCTSAATTVGVGCVGATTPALTLGTGSPAVLTSTASTGAIYSRLGTNAGGGATVRMKVANTCGSLMRSPAAACDIEAVGASTGSADAASGKGKFGVRATSSGGLAAQAPYDNGTTFGMDITSTPSVLSSAGDELVKSTGVVDNVDTTYTFAASAADVTPAGTYTAKITLIAVATY